MRPLLLIAIVLAAPRPADAKMSLARAAARLCECEDLGYPGGPEEILGDAGPRAIAPLLDALLVPQPGDDCTREAWELTVELVCSAGHGDHARAALAPLRAALASPEWRRVSDALGVVRDLNAKRFRGGIESASHHHGPDLLCDDPHPILALTAGDLGRLLVRNRGERRQNVLEAIESLKPKKEGAPLVPALIRVLNDRDFRDRAAVLLTAIGAPAKPAVPPLARLLAEASDLRLESIYATALGAIGAPSPVAAAALPRLLDQAAKNTCATPRRFLTLFRAAVASGPPAGLARPAWESEMVSRAAAALAQIGSGCSDAILERDLIVALARLPAGPAQVALLEKELADQTASIDRRFWSAWALRNLAAPLSPSQAGLQTDLLAPAQPLPPAPEPEVPLDHLFANEIVVGMNALHPQVAECYARHHVAGFATVNVEIAYGRVTSATVTGALAGTPSGACLEGVVKTAKFPLRERVRTGIPFTLK